jgi:hypothetical protein
MTPALRAYLTLSGYTELRLLEGKICGLLPMCFTTGLTVGIDSFGCERRYCFERPADAMVALEAWDGKDHPTGPWIKCKGRYQGAPIDMLNPALETIQ